MQFNIDTARVILRHQPHLVCVVDVWGDDKLMSGTSAADAIRDDMVALGNRRRIKVIKPTDAAIERARNVRADLREVLEHDPRPGHVQPAEAAGTRCEVVGGPTSQRAFGSDRWTAASDASARPVK